MALQVGWHPAEGDIARYCVPSARARSGLISFSRAYSDFATVGIPHKRTDNLP